MLSRSVTAAGVVLFTTFTPTRAGHTNFCEPGQGVARAYAISIEDGTPAYDTDNSGDLTKDDRSRDLVRTGIPPEPTLLFTENGIVTLIGTEKTRSPGLVQRPERTYWKHSE